MKISDMSFSLNVYVDRISLQWKKFSEDARYVLVRKKISKPNTMFDGNRVYIGDDTSYDDYSVINGEIYYYRLFVLPYADDDFHSLTDNQLVLRAIALQFSEAEDYSTYLYGSLPKNVRYSDETMKNQNKPLQRFIRLFCYPFNKVNTYTDSMLNQIDVDTCDEVYLPYHAKWLGRFYDERFGSDINRLLLKTLEEAEPFIGTKMGLEYILQRVFKAEVEITERITNSCFTNSTGLLTNTLMTNGCICVESIKLYFDDDNAWLTTDVASSILRLIMEYCPIRLGLEIISILIGIEKYDRQRMLDDYLHDHIIEVVPDAIEHEFTDVLSDNLDLGTSDANEVYHALGSVMNYPNSGEPTFSTTNVDGNHSKLSCDLVTLATRFEPEELKDTMLDAHSDEYEVFPEDVQHDFIVEQIADEYNTEIDDFDLTISTESNSSMTYENYKFANVKQYPNSDSKYFGLTGSPEATLSNTLVTNAVRFGTQIRIDEFNLTNGGGKTNSSIKTIAISSGDGEIIESSSLTNRDKQMISSGILTNPTYSEQSRISSGDAIVETTNLKYKGVVEDSYNIEKITDAIESFQKQLEDEVITIQKDSFDELSLVSQFGMTNDQYSMLSNNMITNVKVKRNESNSSDSKLFDQRDIVTDKDAIQYSGVKADDDGTNIITGFKEVLSMTNGIGLLNNNLTLGVGSDGNEKLDKSFDDELADAQITTSSEATEMFKIGMTNSPYALTSKASTNARNVRVLDQDESNMQNVMDSFYSGVKAIVETTTILRHTLEALSMLNGVGLLSSSMILGSGNGGHFGDEITHDYSDDADTLIFIRTRPESLIGSDCVLSRSFYTTDISY